MDDVIVKRWHGMEKVAQSIRPNKDLGDTEIMNTKIQDPTSSCGVVFDTFQMRCVPIQAEQYLLPSCSNS